MPPTVLPIIPYIRTKDRVANKAAILFSEGEPMALVIPAKACTRYRFSLNNGVSPAKITYDIPLEEGKNIYLFHYIGVRDGVPIFSDTPEEARAIAVCTSRPTPKVRY